MNDPVIFLVFVLTGVSIASFLSFRRGPQIMVALGAVYLAAISPSSLVIVAFAATQATFLAPWLARKGKNSRLKKYLPYSLLLNLLFVDFSSVLLGFPVATLGISFSVVRIFMTTKEYLGSRSKALPLDVYWIWVAAFYLPALVIGPVFSGMTLKKQVESSSELTSTSSEIWRLILGGFFLAVVASSGIVKLIGDIENPTELQAILLLPLLYFVKLFVTFWGQSLIAENTSKLIGLQLPQNFRQPWLASSPRDFWGRWHRSMADFVMKYIFLPMNINSFSARTSMLASFVFMGLWHNLSFGYLLWGIGHGLALGWYPERWMSRTRVSRVFGRIFTFALVIGLSHVANHTILS